MTTLDAFLKLMSLLLYVIGMIFGFAGMYEPAIYYTVAAIYFNQGNG